MSKRRTDWRSDAARALTLLTGIPDPEAAMIACADDLLNEAGVTEPPVPLKMLASFQGVRAIEKADMQPSGRLIAMPRTGLALAGGHIIQVNRVESPTRQNFTIAHEIAHTFFPAFQARPQTIEDAQTGDYAEDDDEEERLCDIGASALLLPERWLRPLAERREPSLAALQDIAQTFRASVEATARAIARLDVWPFALVAWEPGWRKADRRLAEAGQPIPAALRVSRAIASPSFGLYIPRNKSIPEDSSVYQAYQTHAPTSGLDRLTIGERTWELQAESAYSAYNRNGVLQPRVISFLRPVRQAQSLDNAG